jgi:inosine/xanthosine triphosphatase
MTEPLIFAVGSENPVKISCVAEAVTPFWPTARTVGTRTDSLVSVQPVSDEETYTGAHNRARQALLQVAGADYGVGVEGGIIDQSEGMWAFAWVVMVDRAGREGRGQTGRFLLPPGVAKLVRAGMELGAADDHFFGRQNSKQQEGAIGLLSDRRLTRMELYKQGVLFALLRFLHPEHYGD